MAIPANYRQVRSIFLGRSKTLQKYLMYFPMLMDSDLPFEVTIAYLFQCVERAHRRALYCAIVKKYSANSDLTDEIVQKEYFTREKFDKLMELVFGETVPKPAKQYLKKAEKIRDATMHGGKVNDPKLREAIQDILMYLDEFNSFVKSRANFQPCGDLRGFKGNKRNLDKDTTRWILKGLELSLK